VEGRPVKRTLLLLLLVLAGGCCPKSPPEIRYVPQRVKVPVAVPVPEPPVFERQPLPVDSIPDDAPPGEVVRRLVATILQLQGEVRARDEALEAYRRATPVPRPTSSAPPPAPRRASP